MQSTEVKVTYSKRRQAGGWYVAVDGERVGWATKTSDGWSFYAMTRPGTLMAEQLTFGHPTRFDATYDGLSYLRIYRNGRLYRSDEAYYINENTLRAAAAAVLDARYGKES